MICPCLNILNCHILYFVAEKEELACLGKVVSGGYIQNSQFYVHKPGSS